MKQILSKKQLSAIRGGARWQCLVVEEVEYTLDPNGGDPIPELIGPTVVVEAESASAAADYLHGLYGVGQINCTRA